MRRAALLVWDFVVGDDWVTAAGVVAAIGITALLQSAGVVAWWLIPVSVLALLARSVAGPGRGPPGESS
jgi:hypothetical protein